MNTMENPLREAGPRLDLPSIDETGHELKRGAFLNTIALATSNFRSVFTFLVARLLGPAALGTFSVAWAATDLFSKIGILGLDDAITIFIARSTMAGNYARSGKLFRLAVGLGIVQSAVVAALLISGVELYGDRLGLAPEMVSATAVILCALPGIALYRISTAVSRGMKVMQHDIYSRGVTDSIATTLAFVIVFLLGLKKFAPELAAIAGSTAAGVVALLLAARLFRGVPSERAPGSLAGEMRQLLGYALPISAYQFLNVFILRLDVMMLGWFVGRAPGVTLATVGIYGAAVGIANGLRKVNHAFNPMFAPIIAGMTGAGDHERAAATYARLAQWMLWLLLPALAVMILAGDAILSIYGPVFRQGSLWLTITAVACALEAYVGFGETVIMVQRPRLNLLNSSITCVIAGGANLWLIPRFGVTGAAFGLLLPYVVQGILRFAALRLIFQWRNPWSNLAPPVVAAAIALIPAVACLALLDGIVAQVTAAAAFLITFGVGWRYHDWRSKK